MAGEFSLSSKSRRGRRIPALRQKAEKAGEAVGCPDRREGVRIGDRLRIGDRYRIGMDFESAIDFGCVEGKVRLSNLRSDGGGEGIHAQSFLAEVLCLAGVIIIYCNLQEPALGAEIKIYA